MENELRAAMIEMDKIEYGLEDIYGSECFKAVGHKENRMQIREAIRFLHEAKKGVLWCLQDAIAEKEGLKK